MPDAAEEARAVQYRLTQQAGYRAEVARQRALAGSQAARNALYANWQPLIGPAEVADFPPLEETTDGRRNDRTYPV